MPKSLPVSGFDILSTLIRLTKLNRILHFFA